MLVVTKIFSDDCDGGGVVMVHNLKTIFVMF